VSITVFFQKPFKNLTDPKLLNSSEDMHNCTPLTPITDYSSQWGCQRKEALWAKWLEEFQLEGVESIEDLTKQRHSW